jgi:glycosyltransferase involved in cell wall biosynthesis
MTLSVLIATRNRPDDLVCCLKSMLAQAHDDYEIVVLDQSTSDASERAVKEALGAPDRLRYLRSNTVGKSVALNLLMDAACGDILAFTDDDTEAPPDWLSVIERVFRENPDADIVFGQVFAARPWVEEERIYTPCFYFRERRYLKPGEIAGMGANMAIRREVASRVGRYDTLLGPGTQIPAAEEGDWVYRAQLAGARILLEPTITLIHLASRGLEEWNRVLYGYGMGDAAFTLKHLRCRDWRMIRPFLGRPFRIFARLCHRILHRRFHQEQHYLRGYWKGVRTSLRYRIDRRARVYVQPPNKLQSSPQRT